MYPTKQCISNTKGNVSIVSISRAITIGTPKEDVVIKGNHGEYEPAYNYMNPNGVSYIDGVLNNSILPHELVGVKHTITLVNDTVNSDNTLKSPIFFNGRSVNYYAKLAFYNSIAFDSIPTEADGFTEQELIDYVIDKYELK